MTTLRDALSRRCAGVSGRTAGDSAYKAATIAAAVLLLLSAAL